MKNSRSRSFDLFSSQSFLVPSWSDFVWFAILFLVGAFVGSFAVMGLNKLTAGASQDYLLLVSYPFQFLLIFWYVSAKSKKNRKDVGEETGLAVDSDHFAPVNPWFLAMMVAVGTITCSIVIDPLSAVLPSMSESLKTTMKVLMEGPLWATLLCSLVMAPFFEEWLCRGMILRGLLAKLKPIWAILASALFFALIHGNIQQAVPAFVLGCLFGWVYYKTGSLKLTMLMHFANNLFALCLCYLPGGMDAELMMELFPSKTLYWAIFAMSVALTVLMVVRVRTIAPQRPDGSCDIVKPEPEEDVQ